jgi:hypothetical protein
VVAEMSAEDGGDFAVGGPDEESVAVHESYAAAVRVRKAFGRVMRPADLFEMHV